RALGEVTVREHHVHALVAEDPEAATGGVLAGVLGTNHDAPDPRLEDRLRARAGPAVVAAGLERHVQRRAVQVRAGRRADRLHLGVRSAQRAMEALADDRLLAPDHGAHQRIGTDLAASLLGQLDRP